MNQLRRAYCAYRTGGMPRMVGTAQRRYRDRRRAWTRLGPVTTLLSRAFELQGPPVLVLSLPRSGSSWVGDILGRASDAVYIREPITQGTALRGAPLVPTAAFDIHEPPGICVELGDRAFGGEPSFPRPIARYPQQWSLLERRRRHLVVKEVNAPACGWYLERYRPRVVFLIRHPVAVALSFARQGWDRLESCDDWSVHGRLQGRSLATAFGALGGYAQIRFVEYEKICRQPVVEFRSLYEFAGLTWDAASEQLVHETSTGGDPEEPWILARDSAAKADQWRSSCTQEQADCLRAAFGSYGLQRYTDDEDWKVTAGRTAHAEA